MSDAVAVSRRWLNRFVGVGSILLVLAAAATAYWATLASQARGPATAYPGWVTVLQPTPTGTTDVQVRLSVDAVAGDPDHLMSYGVALCGTGDFSGYRLTGGASVLNGVSVDAGTNTVHSVGTGDLEVREPFASTPSRLGSVQIWRFELSDLPACIGKVENEEFFGTGFRVTGTAPTSVSRADSFGPFRGSTETWAMPYVGNLPGAGQNLGEFEIKGAIGGSFLRPLALASDVDAGRIPLGMTMGDARPATVKVDRAQWHEIQPFQATVRVEDSATLALEQRVSTASSVVLGLAGAIATAYVFEFVRQRPAQASSVVAMTSGAQARDGRRPSRSSARSHRKWWLPVLVAIGLTAVFRVLSRRRPIDN